MTIHAIQQMLCEENIQYEIIRQDKPLLAEGFYPLEKAALTFVLQTEDDIGD